MSKHTPGTWRVIIDDTGGEFTGWPSVGASEELDQTIVHRAGFKQEWWESTGQREAISNARLIAAAPDMLEALQAMVTWMPSGFAPQSKAEAMQKAHAAIAKATGET